MPGPCDISNYVTEYLEANGNRVDIKVHPDYRPTPAQMESVRAALRVIPPTHLRDFDQQGGYIQFSRPGCAPGRGGGNQPGFEPWIRLSHASLSGGHNSAINVTLLHEMGHIVDAQYHAMESIRASNPDGYQLLARTRHEGATQGPGEGFADCYMIYLVTQIARRRYNHPADPRAYQGDNAVRRFQVMLNSPAFQGQQVTTLTPMH